MKKSLQSSEWVLVGSLFLIMASLVLVSKVNAYRCGSTLAEAPLPVAPAEEPAEITVMVRGAVLAPTQLTLPPKSRICDLKTKLSLTPEADKRFFRRRKLLKDGDCIEVPKKTVELNSEH